MMLMAKPRVTMCARGFVFLLGSVFILCQVHLKDVYVAELMLETNITVEAQRMLSALDNNRQFQVLDNKGDSHNVTMTHNVLVAECLLVGKDIACNCSDDYIWSNEICSTYNCCHGSTCKQNMSHITPLCIAKVKVQINGSVILNEQIWDAGKTTKLTEEFQGLHGFEYLNVTGQRLSNSIADFEVALSVKFSTAKLQAILTELETQFQAVLWVDTMGLVTMESPQSQVCYESAPFLECTFDEETDSTGWNMSTTHQRFELYQGSVVKLNFSCSTKEHKSCVRVTLEKVTGIWAGTYECGFTTGSVRHIAKSKLSVALLPEDILLKIKPLTVVCSDEQTREKVEITASISKSIENYKVQCRYIDGCTMQSNTTDGNHQIYTFTASISCKEVSNAQSVTVTFKNSKGQERNSEVDIPVIYVGKKFCSEEVYDGQTWPKTPQGDTAINRTCPVGRVGYKSRTCEGTTWQPVFSNCVNQELNNILSSADSFIQGLGANKEFAQTIFGQLKNSSTKFDSDTDDTTADISTSINILDKMAGASQNVELPEEVYDDFINAASNMLNSSWGGVNKSIVYDMSSNYLQSVEVLVKNIKVNRSVGIASENLELKFCSDSDCQISVFDVNLNLNKTDSGIMKTIGVKNLMDKLKNNFGNRERNSLLVSATLVDSNDSSVEITLDFPKEQHAFNNRFCVFWNTTEREWSEAGCTVKSDAGNRTLCECNHLTSFSILMAKSDISTEVLDIITFVGLGVSICSLLIFLIVEFVVWSGVVKTNLSHFRHTAMVNIATFLLLADSCFLASTFPESLSDTVCLVLTICKHLFFLAMFSWMLCLSVMLVHQLIFVFSPLRKRLFMFLSGVVGYFCPVLIVGSSYVFYKYTQKPYYNRKTCWLVFVKLLDGSLHAFLIPVGTVILTNLFAMVVVISTLVKSSTPEGSKANDKETVKSILKVVIFLTPIFGVTWIIGFALLMLESDSPMFHVANYSFTILNSFQGFFLLVTGCFAEPKVREELYRLIMAKSKGKSESMKNLTSTTYTKDK
uniref:adhesion G-protein coupled receptor F2 n=1 Tax=Semicossyphus pulcher TaxID=241346 RepID=UPI0037E7E237